MSKAKDGTDDPAPLSLHPRYLVLETMRDWQITPDKWRTLHVEDQAEMMALTHTRRAIEAYQTDFAKFQAQNKAVPIRGE